VARGGNCGSFQEVGGGVNLGVLEPKSGNLHKWEGGKKCEGRLGKISVYWGKEKKSVGIKGKPPYGEKFCEKPKEKGFGGKKRALMSQGTTAEYLGGESWTDQGEGPEGCEVRPKERGGRRKMF